MEVYGKGRVRRSELFKLAREIIKWKWKDRKFLKRGKKLDMITTNDLDDDNKLYPDYLEKRSARKASAKKEREDSPFRYSR